MWRKYWEGVVGRVVRREPIWELCHDNSSLEATSAFPPSPILWTDLSLLQEEINEADIFKCECKEIGRLVECLFQMLQSINGIATSTPTFYARPVNQIANEVSRCLQISSTLVKKCRWHNLLHRVATPVSTDDFKELLNLLASCLENLNWVLGIYEEGRGAVGSDVQLPPMARKDPTIAWVWYFISYLHMGQLRDQIEAAKGLVLIARDHDRGKQTIVEEGGISPLLKLLKNGTSIEERTTAASALYYLADDYRRVGVIIDESGIPIIVGILVDSPMKVQICLANLVSKMAEHCPRAQEDLAGENVIRSLVTLLDNSKLKFGNRCTDHINEEMKRQHLSTQLEREDNGMKLQLKISCAEALWMLAKGCVLNCWEITETVGLLCLAKLVETEVGEMQYNCLMAIMEICAAAESDPNLRRAAFKINSQAAKAAIEQLLRVIKDTDDRRLRIAAMRAIGSLAKAFPARETRVIGPLVEKLSHRDRDVAIEAAISLGKFANPENFLCEEHSKTIMEFGGVEPIMKLLSRNVKARFHGMMLICYLAFHHGKSSDFERAGVEKALEEVDPVLVALHPELKEWIPQALFHLSLFHPSHFGMLAVSQQPLLAPSPSI